MIFLFLSVLIHKIKMVKAEAMAKLEVLTQISSSFGGK